MAAAGMGNGALASNNMMQRSIGCQIPAICGSLLGSAVKGTLGIGMGMVTSPLLALADRDFIPGAIVIG